MLPSLRMQIDLLIIFSFFWPPMKTKQSTEALRGWFIGWHKLKTRSARFTEDGSLLLFFLSFVVYENIFQFFFFWWWRWFKGIGNIFSWLPCYSFSILLHLLCLSPDTLFCARQNPLRTLKSHMCLGLPAWWSLMGSPIWSKRYLARTTVGAHLFTSRCWHWSHQVGKLFTYRMLQPPVDKAVLGSTFWV